MNFFFSAAASTFVSYGLEHCLIVLSSVVISYIILKRVKKKDKSSQRNLALWIAGVLISFQIIFPIIHAIQGRFDLGVDLPLHLCSIMPIALMVCYISGSKKIWRIIVFWLLVGCSQSLLTPTIDVNFPHPDSINYWFTHMGIVFLGFYPVVLWDWRIRYRDILRSLLWLNVIAAFVFTVNYLLGTNYMYLMHKPEVESLFDVMGPWPYYILVAEFVFILLTVPLVFIFKLIKSDNIAMEVDHV